MFKPKILLFILFFWPFIMSGQLYYDFIHDGLERDYILYLPENLPEDAPLVFMLHGYSSSAYTLMNYCGMNQVADQHKFAVCYPRGIKDDWDNNFWNVGYDFHANETVDDVGFIIALAEYLQTNYNLSIQFTFCSGMSNGGDMSYMLACQASESFMAAAPVAGCMMEWLYNSCEPEIVIPLFEIHGTNDEVTWWNGDINNIGEWGPYMGVPDAIEFWSELNNTSEYSVEYLPDTDPNDGSYIKAEKYTEGINGQEVWLYKVVDGGHDWPGSWGNMDIDSSEEIWSFFSQVMQNGSQGTYNQLEKPIVKVHKIYPNPFHAETTITYEIFEPSFINISIYNVYGNKIDTIINNYQLPGKKSVIWNTNKLRNHIQMAGIYYCRIQAESFTLIKQIIITN